MLDDLELEQLATLYGLQLRGIYLKDQVPSPLPEGFVIYNLDARRDPVSQNSLGTHWVCSLNARDECFYFDSFACVPPAQIERAFKHKYEHYAHNNYIVQDLASEACGFYCIALALFVKQHQQTLGLLGACNKFIDLFHDDAKKNDAILKRFLWKAANKTKVFNPLRLLLKKL